MTHHDLDDLESRLQGLAAGVERTANSVEPARVRRLGQRRRHRRHVRAAVAACAVIGLAGGAVLTQVTGSTSQTPPPVASGPTAVPLPRPSTASPVRTLSSANLLRAADVPPWRGRVLEVAPDGTGRAVDEVSACVPDGISVLGATDTAARDFRYPAEQRPAFQTVALQFVDTDAAQQAEQTLSGWVEDCGDTLEGRGATLLNDRGSEWVDVTTPPGTSGRFVDLDVYREQAQTGEDGVFESLGVTRVGDRLMLTVRLVSSTEDYVSLEGEAGAVDGMPVHPQYGLVRAAAERLAP